MLAKGFILSRSAVQTRRSRREAAFPWHWVVLAVVVTAALFALANYDGGGLSSQRPVPSKLKLANIPVNGERAYGYLKDLCAIGPRFSGSEGMQQQQAQLKEHFSKLGGRVSFQEFNARNPLDGKTPVKMANLIVEWHPDRSERILLCAHYDTRPFPDEDPVNTRGIFVGANDGASGTAVLCELAHHIPTMKTNYGVDFVLFDGEELVYDGQRDPYFLGSEHFAREYAAMPPKHRYKAGVLLDMVGDAQLQIFREVNSMQTPGQRQIVNDIWSIARDLGVREFVNRTEHEVRDDHLALNNIAKIPTIDIIDFDYPVPRGPNYWHTTLDVPEKCSPLSLAKVGWVVKVWVERVK
jgi:hypothetical protein